MEPSAVVLVALLALVALLVGVAIPTLVQMRRTAASAQQFFDGTNRRLGPVLDDVREAAARLNRVSAGIEEGTRGVQDAFRSIQDIVRSLGKLRDSLRTAASVGTALGPALAAGTRALFEIGTRDGKGRKTSAGRKKTTAGPSRGPDHEQPAQEPAEPSPNKPEQNQERSTP